METIEEYSGYKIVKGIGGFGVAYKVTSRPFACMFIDNRGFRKFLSTTNGRIRTFESIEKAKKAIDKATI